MHEKLMAANGTRSAYYAYNGAQNIAIIYVYPPTMFFLCTFYDRGFISEHPAWGFSIHLNIIPPPRPRPASRCFQNYEICATKLLLCSSLFAFDTHMALATFFPPKWITRTHMKSVGRTGDAKARAGAGGKRKIDNWKLSFSNLSF